MKPILKMLVFTSTILALIVGSVLLQGCAVSKFISGQKVEMFTLNLDSKKVVVQLPSELSKDKFADVRGERFHNVRLYQKAYNYNVDDKPGYEYVNFWCTYHLKEAATVIGSRVKIVMIVWVSRTDERKIKNEKVWLYNEEGLPISITAKQMNKILYDIYMGKS